MEGRKHQSSSLTSSYAGHVLGAKATLGSSTVTETSLVRDNETNTERIATKQQEVSKAFPAKF